MNQPIKFPDMRPANPRRDIRIPPPSAFAQRVPSFPTTDAIVKNRRVERKRLVLWFGIAVALHAALLLGIWLMPSLRIKWEPSPDAWVEVTSLPPAAPAVQAAAAPAPVPRPATATATATAPKPAAAKASSALKPKTPARDAGVPVSLLPQP
jgi:hypothetical protein